MNCNKQIRLAHAAGVFDVRGSILLRKSYVGKNTPRVLEVRLTGIEKVWPVMEYLQSEFGGIITNGVKDGSRKNWVLVGQKAQDFLEQIEPYFKNTKRIARASFIRRRLRLRGKNYKGLGKREYDRREKMEADWDTLFIGGR